MPCGASISAAATRGRLSFCTVRKFDIARPLVMLRRSELQVVPCLSSKTRRGCESLGELVGKIKSSPKATNDQDPCWRGLSGLMEQCMGHISRTSSPLPWYAGDLPKRCLKRPRGTYNVQDARRRSRSQTAELRQARASIDRGLPQKRPETAKERELAARARWPT